MARSARSIIGQQAVGDRLLLGLLANGDLLVEDLPVWPGRGRSRAWP